MRAVLALLGMCLLLAGCWGSMSLDGLAQGDEVEFSRHYFDLVKNGKFEELAGMTKVGEANVREDSATMKALMTQERELDIQLVGYRSLTQYRNSIRSFAVTLQYHYEEKWLMAALQFHADGNGYAVTSAKLTPMRQSLQSLNEFLAEREGDGPLPHADDRHGEPALLHCRADRVHQDAHPIAEMDVVPGHHHIMRNHDHQLDLGAAVPSAAELPALRFIGIPWERIFPLDDIDRIAHRCDPLPRTALSGQPVRAWKGRR